MEKVYYPFFKKFKCLAGDCPVGCCFYRISLLKRDEEMLGKRSDWADIDGRGNDIREYLNHDKLGWFFKSRADGECIFLNEKRLCNIQLRYGQEAIPCECRTFPRIIGRYGNRVEFGMDPCCPLVASSAMDWEPGDFLTEGLSEGCDDGKFKKRDKAISILSDRGKSLGTCIEEVAALYGSSVEVPGVDIDGGKEEFIRRVTALCLWSYLLYYDGIPGVTDIAGITLRAAAKFIGKVSVTEYSSLMDMSTDFSRLIINYFDEQGFNLDYDDRYFSEEDV